MNECVDDIKPGWGCCLCPVLWNFPSHLLASVSRSLRAWPPAQLRPPARQLETEDGKKPTPARSHLIPACPTRSQGDGPEQVRVLTEGHGTCATSLASPARMFHEPVLHALSPMGYVSLPSQRSQKKWSRAWIHSPEFGSWLCYFLTM